MVCKKDYETRHPQEFIKVVQEDVTPPWTRPEQDDVFTHICYLWAMSGYADLAEADCARADYVVQTYQFLVELKAG